MKITIITILASHNVYNVHTVILKAQPGGT